MSLFGALGGQLLLFALALLLMQAALRKGGSTSLFAALPLGLLPSLIVAVGLFWQVQDRTDPEMLSLRQGFNTQVEHKATEIYPKPEDSAQRDAYRQAVTQGFEVVPAFMFSCHLGLLAAMAVALRRRLAKVGAMPEVAPLWQWTAPWGLVWLILGPGLLLAGANKGLLDIKEAGIHAAWNILVVGLAVTLFQGAVVFWAKLRSWWLVPASRPLVFIVLLCVFLSLWLQSALGLVAFLFLTGLFEPWVDARRLRRPPLEPGLKP
jgi:hypothetical protein